MIPGACGGTTGPQPILPCAPQVEEVIQETDEEPRELRLRRGTANVLQAALSPALGTPEPVLSLSAERWTGSGLTEGGIAGWGVTQAENRGGLSNARDEESLGNSLHGAS